MSASVNDYTQCCDTLGLLLTSLEHKISIAIDSALESMYYLSYLVEREVLWKTIPCCLLACRLLVVVIAVVVVAGPILIICSAGDFC